MLVTITDLKGLDGTTLRQWRQAKFALCHNNKIIVCMSKDSACQALKTPAVREPTLDELRAWFKWQEEHGRTNQRFVEGGLPWPADD